MTGVLIRREETQTKIQREESHMKIKSGFGVMLPQAKEHVGLPEARGGKEVSSLRAFGGSMALQQVDFRFLASRTVR